MGLSLLCAVAGRAVWWCFLNGQSASLVCTPMFLRNHQEGSRWSPSVILKCVNRNYRLPSNIRNVIWLPCLLCWQKELLHLHHPDKQGQTMHVETAPCSEGGGGAAPGRTPQKHGGSGLEKQPRVLIVLHTSSLPSMSS